MRGLQITVGYQLNMSIIPRLVPGNNALYLQAEKLDGVKLVAEWAYGHPSPLVLVCRRRIPESTRTPSLAQHPPLRYHSVFH